MCYIFNLQSLFLGDSLFGVISENFGWDIPKQYGNDFKIITKGWVWLSFIRVVLLIPTVLIVLPLSTLRSIAPLRITGLISFVLIMFLSGCIIFRGVQHITDRKHGHFLSNNWH